MDPALGPSALRPAPGGALQHVLARQHRGPLGKLQSQQAAAVRIGEGVDQGIGVGNYPHLGSLGGGRDQSGQRLRGCFLGSARLRLALMKVIWFLIVGVIAGWLAGLLVKGGGFGLIGDLVVGILGALIGGLLLGGGLLGGGLLGSIVVATLGAVILLVVLRVIKKA